ncbi:MAG: lipocalin family protein, partial [Planctomycetota bacterium]
QGASDVGSLSVTFFWPFAGGYHVIALDPGYEWAMVAGPSRKYLWILSRRPSLPQATYDLLVQQARDWDFDTDELIRVSHGVGPAQASR